MKNNERLRIAIQKNGRLNRESMSLLRSCGLKFYVKDSELIARCEDAPVDIVFVRDDDIPMMIFDGMCDLGIVGKNVLIEQTFANEKNAIDMQVKSIMPLGFAKCRLAMAYPETSDFDVLMQNINVRIATSYPNIVRNYLNSNNMKGKIYPISGSVEITPQLDMADVICDLVSSGKTLQEHSLKEGICLLESEAVLIQSPQKLSDEKICQIDVLRSRIEGIIQARETKYIMFHAPTSAIEKIKSLLPGAEEPTIFPLAGRIDMEVVHVVSYEGAFWATLEKLQAAGASSILVLPIEKMLK